MVDLIQQTRAYGSVFVPPLGILTADYFVLRRREYDPGELYRTGGRYWYTRGTNWTAMGVWLGGFVLYLVLAGLPQVGLTGLAPWMGATLPTFFFGFGIYSVIGVPASSGRNPGAAHKNEDDDAAG